MTGKQYTQCLTRGRELHEAISRLMKENEVIGGFAFEMDGLRVSFGQSGYIEVKDAVNEERLRELSTRAIYGDTNAAVEYLKELSR